MSAWTLAQTAPGTAPAAGPAVRADGAPHGSEIPYVFNTLGTGGFGPPPPPPTPEDRAVAQKVQAYWVNLAKNGDPNGPGLTTWP